MSLLRWLLLRLAAEPQRSLCRGETGSRKGGNPRADLGHRLAYSRRFLGFSIVAGGIGRRHGALRTALCKRAGSPALVSSCHPEQCVHGRTQLGQQTGFWGTVGLLSLWLNSDVMWELGAHQAMSAFGVCPRWDALTEQLSSPLERCSDLLQAPAAGTSCLI